METRSYITAIQSMGRVPLYRQVPIDKGTTVTTHSTYAVTENFVDSAQYTITMQTAKGNTITNTAYIHRPISR